MKASYEILKDHPINQARIAAGKLPANMIWPWGAGRAMMLDNFVEKYGRTGTVISAVPLVWGIAELAGLKHPEVPGANGDLDTNYEGKVCICKSRVSEIWIANKLYLSYRARSVK